MSRKRRTLRRLVKAPGALAQDRADARNNRVVGATIEEVLSLELARLECAGEGALVAAVGGHAAHALQMQQRTTILPA